MAARRLIVQAIASTKAWASLPSLTPRLTSPFTTPSFVAPAFSRSFSSVPRLYASPAPNPASGVAAPYPKDAIPPTKPAIEDPDEDSARHAAFLGEGDSNDGHDAVQEAYGDPPASLDASNSAYLGEADSDDGFEAHKDVEGRDQPPVDAIHSAFLGESDSDDGFEGRRVAYPEEGDHRIEDTSGSGIHGQSGEGDSYDDHDHKR